MDINLEIIKEELTNSEKPISIDKTNEMYYLGKKGVAEAFLTNDVVEKELRDLFKSINLSLKKESRKGGFQIKHASDKPSSKRKGYPLILENKNNGNFKEVKRLAKELDDPTHEGLQLSNEGWIVKLNKHNSDLVEKMVEMNDTYSISFAKYVYKGICSEHNNKFPKTNRKAVEAMIRVIDRDNSTQVWQHDKNRIKKMVEFIIDSKNKFWTKLKKGNVDLIEKLIDGSRMTEKDSDLVSLSSKVCKYLLEYETGEKDKYFISDRFVRRSLPFYCAAYGIEVEGLKLNASFFSNNKDKDYKYPDLFKVLEKLQKHINQDKQPGDNDYLDKHRVDHILWFCYRNGSEVEKKKRDAAAGN